MAQTWLDKWLPNIVCTVIGCVLSFASGWLFSHKTEERNSHILQTLLVTLSENKLFNLELDRDQDGMITGMRRVRMTGDAVDKSSAGGDLTTRPASTGTQVPAAQNR